MCGRAEGEGAGSSWEAQVALHHPVLTGPPLPFPLAPIPASAGTELPRVQSCFRPPAARPDPAHECRVPTPDLRGQSAREWCQADSPGE